MPVRVIPVDAVKRSEIVFPTRERPVLKVRTDSLPLKVFQSVFEMRPAVTVAVDASGILRVCVEPTELHDGLIPANQFANV